MSFLRASARPPVSDSEELVRRYLEAVVAHSDPDPLFRRRLRGVVVNRYVAAREGVVVAPRTRRSTMGLIGRACLVASVALAMSVGGVMAASRTALPGDLLYPIKRELEAVRMRVLQPEFHDDLAVYALGQRINEIGRLAEAGNWDAIAALLPEIDAAYATLVEMDALEPDGSASVGSGPAMLAQLLDGLPAPARAAIDRALDVAPGLNDDAPRGRQPTGAGRPRPDRPHTDPPGAARGRGTAPVLDEAEGEPAAVRTPKPKAAPEPNAPADTAERAVPEGEAFEESETATDEDDEGAQEAEEQASEAE